MITKALEHFQAALNCVLKDDLGWDYYEHFYLFQFLTLEEIEKEEIEKFIGSIHLNHTGPDKPENWLYALALPAMANYAKEGFSSKYTSVLNMKQKVFLHLLEKNAKEFESRNEFKIKQYETDGALFNPKNKDSWINETELELFEKLSKTQQNSYTEIPFFNRIQLSLKLSFEQILNYLDDVEGVKAVMWEEQAQLYLFLGSVTSVTVDFEKKWLRNFYSKKGKYNEWINLDEKRKIEVILSDYSSYRKSFVPTWQRNSYVRVSPRDAFDTGEQYREWLDE